MDFKRRGDDDPGYPRRPPTPGEGSAQRKLPASLAKWARAAIEPQLDRLENELVPKGWEVSTSMTMSSGSNTLAMLHIFINGEACGYSLAPGKTFWTAQPGDQRWYELRIWGDEVVGGTVAKCLHELVKRLESHITDLIEHFRRYDTT